jgi:hypothetical protein
MLYLITPVPLHRLQSVDLLLQGLIEIPTSLLQVASFSSFKKYISTSHGSKLYFIILYKITSKNPNISKYFSIKKESLEFVGNVC